MTDAWRSVLEKLNIFFITVYTSEMLIKLFALRQYYFTVGWNIFDLVVLILSFMALLLEDLKERYFHVSPAMLRVVCLLFLQNINIYISYP